VVVALSSKTEESRSILPKITVILADDEIHALERLRDLLDRFDCFDILAEVTDGNEALNAIITHSPQVAFLDINMPGISVFQTIPSLKEPPLIVFQTAYSEHAADAFDINALDYLLKPVRFERLEKTVEKIKTHFPDEPVVEPEKVHSDTISVKVNGRIEIIHTVDIVRISFEQGFCFIYTASDKFMSDKYLNAYEEILEPLGFFRASRNDLVNLKSISSVMSQSLRLDSGDTVDLSRRKAHTLKKLLNLQPFNTFF
jgi:DNA-binding LytR/AlgR family response regulator